jgi:hypothetical protein
MLVENQPPPPAVLGKLLVFFSSPTFAYFSSLSLWHRSKLCYSHLFSAHSTLWFVKNFGKTLQYSKGETPVAAQPTDLVSLGLEFKY